MDFPQTVPLSAPQLRNCISDHLSSVWHACVDLVTDVSHPLLFARHKRDFTWELRALFSFYDHISVYSHGIRYIPTLTASFLASHNTKRTFVAVPAPYLFILWSGCAFLATFLVFLVFCDTTLTTVATSSAPCTLSAKKRISFSSPFSLTHFSRHYVLKNK